MSIIELQERAEACKLLKENYEDAHIAILSAIHKTWTVILPDRPSHERVEELVLTVKTVRASLKAAVAEQQIFAGCFTLESNKVIGP